jgi:hypothetical protein
LKYGFRLLLTVLFAAACLSVSAIDWKQWTYGDIRVTASPKDTSYATLVVKKLHKRINAFQMKLGVYPVPILDIVIVPSREEYKRITFGKGKLVGSSEAFYSPLEKLIYVRSPEQISMVVYDDILMHEYVHWFLDETLDNVPLWFHEGMAMYYSGQFGYQTYYEFTRNRFLGYKLSLYAMQYNYPSSKAYWNMFYLTSVFAVDRMATRDHQQWENFWDRVSLTYNQKGTVIHTRSDFILTFNAAYRMSLFAFSRDFDKAMKRYGWQFPLIGINALLLSLLPVVVLLGWIRSRRRMKAMPDVIEEPEAELTEEELDMEEEHSKENPEA